MVSDIDVSLIKDISIMDVLEKKGIRLEKEGNRYKCRSPFSSDRTPSFYFYPHTNSFYDFANGIGGDVIRLVQEMESVGFTEALDILSEGKFEKLQEFEYKEEKKEFVLDKYILRNRRKKLSVRSYALYRGIVEGFIEARYMINIDEELIPRIGLGFVHTDYDGNVCGIKIRDIMPVCGRRFAGRGEQKYYVLDTDLDNVDGKIVYIAESETSANSLYSYLKKIKVNAVVISFGSWNNIPSCLPYKYNQIADRKFIIDYDGDQEKYEERISRFNHLNANDIKIELPKGEDINSLFVKGLINNYKNKIVN